MPIIDTKNKKNESCSKCEKHESCLFFPEWCDDCTRNKYSKKPIKDFFDALRSSGY